MKIAAVLLYDALIMTLFVAMACHFNHWWISLFGIIGLMTYKE